jgi:hypothetical protein
MKRHLTGSDLFAEILMTRTAYKHTILILEGTTDCSVFEEFRHPNCIAIPASGRQIAVDAMMLCDTNRKDGILAVLDADFSRFGIDPVSSSNIILTDAHDIEMIVLTSPAFQRILRQYSHASLLQTFLVTSAWPDIVHALLVIASKVGHMRLLAMKTGQRLKFRKVNLAAHIDRATLQVNVRTFTTTLLSHSPNATCDQSWILTQAAALESAKLDLLQLCSGHDVTTVLSVGLQSAIGKCHPQVADRQNIERVFRASFGRAELESTSMYQEIRQWENRNAPYRVLS